MPRIVFCVGLCNPETLIGFAVCRGGWGRLYGCLHSVFVRVSGNIWAWWVKCTASDACVCVSLIFRFISDINVCNHILSCFYHSESSGNVSCNFSILVTESNKIK